MDEDIVDEYIRTEILCNDEVKFYQRSEDLLLVTKDAECSPGVVRAREIRTILRFDPDGMVSDDEIAELGTDLDDDGVAEEADALSEERIEVLSERLILSLQLTRKIPLYLLRSMTEGDINDTVWNAVRAAQNAQTSQEASGEATRSQASARTTELCQEVAGR